MEYLPYLVIVSAEEIGTPRYQYDLRDDDRYGFCMCRCLVGVKVDGSAVFFRGEWVTSMTCRKVGAD